jgi:hypothetical protein
VSALISRQSCGDGCGCNQPELFALTAPNGSAVDHSHSAPAAVEKTPVAAEFFRRILAEDISPADVFRITTTSFMDAYNFDVRQAMKDCVHFVLPSGHIIPFSAYNLLYRNGRVPLPALRPKGETPRFSLGSVR